ncbi:hypothetical protein RUND412_011621, partial [Rhizina undulata]
GTASPDIGHFIADPENFLRNHAVNCQEVTRSTRTDGYAKLVETNHGYNLTDHGSNEHNTAFAYYLGYKAGNQLSPRPAWVDIPRNAVEGTFLFTGSLSGCSVVVTEHPTDPTLYRVFHDSRLESSLFYDHVIMAVDFLDYRFQNAETGMAAVFLQYKDNQWRLFVQLQTLRQDNHTTYPTLRDIPAEGVITKNPGSYDRPHNRERFIGYREGYQNEVFELGRGFGYEQRPIEDVFFPQPIGRENGTFRSWEDLRKKIANLKKNLQDSLNSLQKKITAFPPNDPLLKYYGRMSEELKTNIEIAARKYDPELLEASRKADYVWLWIRKKEVEGFNAVVELDGQLRAGIETIGERYSEVELD